MQKIITIILGVFIPYLFPLLVNAQTYFPFPDPNSTWNYLKKDKSCMNLPEQCTVNGSTLSYDVNGDTVINSKTYHKIFRSNYLCAIREDSLKRVYRIWPLDTEKKIFDFSASIGDTVSFNPVGMVTGIDSVLIDNQYRKRFITGSDTIIEGIGSMHNLIFDIIFYPDFAPTFDMLCYQRNDTVKFTNPVYNTCDTSFSYTILLGINEDVLRNKLTIYPNPTTSQFTLKMELKESTELFVKLYHFTGQLIYLEEIGNVSGNYTQQIDLSGYSKGVYFVQISTENNILTRKVVHY